MSPPIPLGQRESQGLEFKSAEALVKPFTISREVVAMLNADGGEVWIGLREDEGIAVEAQRIAEPETQRLKLLDHLMEVLEPRHRPEEVVVEIIDSDPGDRSRGQVLRIRARAGEGRKPFALLHQGGRQYLLRVDHRIRAMTREEIFDAQGANAGVDPEQARLARLHFLNDRVVRAEKAGLWVAICPVPELRWDVQAPAFRDALAKPAVAGNRASGWNYGAGGGTSLKLGQDHLESALAGHCWARAHEDGCIETWNTIRGLHHRADDQLEIYPLALLELVVSVARLAMHLYGVEGLGPPQAVLLDGTLFAPGWQLPAYPPGTWGYGDPFHGAPGGLEEGRWLLRAPLRFEWDDFRSHPDHAAYLLVRQIYQAFGLQEDRIPSAYDRVQRRLVLPD